MADDPVMDLYKHYRKKMGKDATPRVIIGMMIVDELHGLLNIADSLQRQFCVPEGELAPQAPDDDEEDD